MLNNSTKNFTYRNKQNCRMCLCYVMYNVHIMEDNTQHDAQSVSTEMQ